MELDSSCWKVVSILSLKRAPSTVSSMALSMKHHSKDACGTELSLPRFQSFQQRGGLHFLSKVYSLVKLPHSLATSMVSRHHSDLSNVFWKNQFNVKAIMSLSLYLLSFFNCSLK